MASLRVSLGDLICGVICDLTVYEMAAIPSVALKQASWGSKVLCVLFVRLIRDPEVIFLDSFVSMVLILNLEICRGGGSRGRPRGRSLRIL